MMRAGQEAGWVSRSVLINLIAIGLVVGAFTIIPHYVGPGLPAANRYIVQAWAIAFVAGWLFQLVRPTPPHGVGRVAWPFSSSFVIWGGIILLTGAFWLWMPYADERVMLACVICQICTVTVYIMTTIEPPPSRPRPRVETVILPVSIALYLAVHPTAFSPPLVVFIGCYAVTILLLQRFVQHAVDEAFAARRAAETAVVQVAAERDAKTRFLASASHDLGQPLQAARLSFDQVLRSTDAGQRERAVRRVGWAFDTTEQLLRRILDHLRLESGAIEAKVGRLAVGPLIARVAELHEPAARLAGVEIVVLPSRLEAMADPELVERALSNLVVNSLRHAKARRVLIGARRHAGRVRLWVIDDGVGISAADGPRLFEDYVQGSNHGDEVRGGFGLGLASARRMAHLMGGDIALEGKWLNGSAFRLELPAADAKVAV
jgi:signal transduction histidine kinase